MLSQPKWQVFAFVGVKAAPLSATYAATAWLVLTYAAANSYITGFGLPRVDNYHRFRQAQTAMLVYSMVHGGLWRSCSRLRWICSIRAFLIESTALFFSMSALSIGIEILRDRRVDKRLLWLAGSATLAMLVKVTTGFVYLTALCLLFAGSITLERERRVQLRYFAFS